MKETLRTPVQDLPRPEAPGPQLGPISGITLGLAVTQPLQPLRRPDSKGAKRVEGDPPGGVGDGWGSPN